MRRRSQGDMFQFYIASRKQLTIYMLVNIISNLHLDKSLAICVQPKHYSSITEHILPSESVDFFIGRLYKNWNNYYLSYLLV